ncbi:MFS transporter [Pseudoclavibacter sp. RFBA6]|uniref:MFS transporter n=1 Tax=Pseudoclavibacter sp. RFBA6 TaxID=2080573 RepID=UPI000CE7EC2E|nr:MFS transporter [Pseudoclavibacter sp. RFBA6]PPG37458.1 MFS transporter [Pseudoclavibacter sp. RFBA6]
MTILTKRQRWSLLVTVTAGLLLITLDNSILYTALPTLTAELGASSIQGLWIINAYPLVMAGLLLGSGTLGDRVGHTRMFIIGLVVFGGASLLAAFSPTPEILIASRAVLAVGAAAMMPATLALIRTNFTIERERNIAIAVWGSIAVIGSALGPIVGGTLLEFFWWGSVFLVNVPVVILALIATLILRPANHPDPSKKWDAISSLQVMVGLVGTVFAIKELGHIPPSVPTLVAAVLVAAIGFFLFARRQRRMTQPLIEFSIFRNAAFTSGVLAAAFAMFASAGIQLVTTQRFQLVAGFSPLEAGLLVAAVAVGSLPTAMLGGAFLHRVGLLALVAGGLGFGTVGTVVTIIGFQTSFGLLIVGLLLTGAGLGAAMSVASTAIIGNVPVNRAGMAASVEEVSYEFGSLTAVALLGSALSLIFSATVVLPAGAPDAAREGITDALQVANGDTAIIAAASAALDSAYLVVMIIVAVVLAIGAAVTGVLLRTYLPGTQSQLHSEH